MRRELKRRSQEEGNIRTNYGDIGRVTFSSEFPGGEASADFAQNVVMPENLASFIVLICTDPVENCTLNTFEAESGPNRTKQKNL